MSTTAKYYMRGFNDGYQFLCNSYLYVLFPEYNWGVNDGHRFRKEIKRSLFISFIDRGLWRFVDVLEPLNKAGIGIEKVGNFYLNK